MADFGISRYAEAATAAETRKFAMSLPWAAPERWRAERATGSTDVYSLGVIAYQLFSGRLPFPGPEQHDYREQHLHRTPEPLTAPASVRALVAECLSKAPEARPSAQEFASRLRRQAVLPLSSGLSALADANARLAQVAAESSGFASRQRTEAERAVALMNSAKEGFARVSEEFLEALRAIASSASVQAGREHGWELRLDRATLTLRAMEVDDAHPWGGWEPPAFRVVAHASVSVGFAPDRHGYQGRGHSLWFCDAERKGSFGWYETAFCDNAFARRTSSRVPFALPPGEESAKALWMGLAEYDVAWPFERLVSGEVDHFVARWAGWLASAAEGRLSHPSTMPERTVQGSWRIR